MQEQLAQVIFELFFNKFELTFSGDDILREAVEVLQMDAIEDMETEIGLLEQENEEKETQIQQLKSDNEEKITKMNNEFERKIEEIKRDKLGLSCAKLMLRLTS